MAIVSRSLGVVEDGFVRDTDAKDGMQDESGFAGAQGEGDEEREDQTKDVGRIINFTNVDGGFKRRWQNKVFGFEQILAVSVVELELRRFGFSQRLFGCIEFFERV